MFNKKQSVKNNQREEKSIAKLWQSVSEEKQVDIKGGEKISTSLDTSIATASAWPPKWYPFC